MPQTCRPSSGGRRNIPIRPPPGTPTRPSSPAPNVRLFAQHGLLANIYMEPGSSEAFKQAFMTGLGISVLSRHNLALELETGRLTVLDVEHFPLVRQWYAVHLKGKKLSNTTRRFLDFLLQDGARIWRDNRPHIQAVTG